MTNPQITTGTQAPRIPTGREIYDMIMGHIEPDLTTEGKKTWKQKYAGETREQKILRMQRYKESLQRYDKAFAEYTAVLKSQVRRYRSDLFHGAEQRGRKRDDVLFSQIENAILS